MGQDPGYKKFMGILCLWLLKKSIYKNKFILKNIDLFI